MRKTALVTLIATPLSLGLSLTLGTGCSSVPGNDSEPPLVQRARAIHERVLTLDTHKDISPALALAYKGDDPKKEKAWRERSDPTVRGQNQVDFPKMREGAYDCAFFIVYVGQSALNGGGYVRAKRAALLKFDAIHRMVKKYPEHIGLAYSPDDVRRIHASGRLVACIGIENGYAMGTNLSLIETFHQRGARYMSLTHNGHSQLGDSHTPTKPLHGGLTDLGRQAILEMNRVGIMVDISHSSKETMMQALAVSKAPVIASHSACSGVYEHGRNLDDEQLLALQKNGGVIQIVAFASYVKDYAPRNEAIDALYKGEGLPTRREIYLARRSGKLSEEIKKELETLRPRVEEIQLRFPNANVSDVVDHIDHAVKLIGIDHVAISSDFDGGGGVDGWQDASETFNVTKELVRRGYSEEQIAKLWSGNTLRLWAKVEGVSKILRKYSHLETPQPPIQDTDERTRAGRRLLAEPTNLERLIWFGRHLAYAGSYQEAIELYDTGLALHPDSPKLLRHRGHREISLRRFDTAIGTLEAAAKRIAGRADEVEPDGKPNARNIPTSTLHTNIWYHKGLAHYCKGQFERAMHAYRICLEAAKNRDMQVAARYWLYLSAKRAQNDVVARKALEPVAASWDIIENHAYHKLLLLFKGELKRKDLTSTKDAIQNQTLAYGLARHLEFQGQREAAHAALKRLAAQKSAAFGCITAEADLSR